jgi:hypothetical protein
MLGRTPPRLITPADAVHLARWVLGRAFAVSEMARLGAGVASERALGEDRELLAALLDAGYRSPVAGPGALLRFVAEQLLGGDAQLLADVGEAWDRFEMQVGLGAPRVGLVAELAGRIPGKTGIPSKAGKPRKRGPAGRRAGRRGKG